MEILKRFYYKKKYSYTAKFYKGVPVLTLSDIAKITQAPPYTYMDCLKRNHHSFLKGIDYWHLKGGMLLEFWNENPYLSRKTRGMLIVSPVGLLKLRDILVAEKVKAGGEAGGNHNKWGNRERGG